MQFYFAVCCFLLAVIHSSACQQTKLRHQDIEQIKAVIDFLKIKSTLWIAPKNKLPKNLIKNLGQFSTVLHLEDLPERRNEAETSNLILDLQSYISIYSLVRIARRQRAALVFGPSSEIDRLPVLPRLDQLVYFLATDTGDVSEAYTVNGVNNTRLVGAVAGGTFVKQNHEEDNFYVRRSNFNGARLRALVEIQPPYLNMAANVSRDEGAGDFYPVDPASLSGLMPEVVAALGEAMNFTVEFWGRKDGVWGRKVGKDEWSGMVGRGGFDFCLSFSLFIFLFSLSIPLSLFLPFLLYYMSS